jgi:hypothetical protein
MKKFRTIELGSTVAFYSKAGSKKIEGSEGTVPGYPQAFYSQKMFYTKPLAFGVVTKIKGHNAHACRVFLDNGQEIEIGLDTHYHLNGEIGECKSHQEKYSII